MKIQIIETDSKGRCLIAQRDIVATETLEIAPFLMLTAEKRRDLQHMAGDLSDYPFADPRFYRPHLPCRGMLVFGLMSFANHWWQPNAIVSWEFNGCFAKLVALGNIPRGREICIRYTDIVEYENTEAWTGPLEDGLAAGDHLPVPGLPVRHLPESRLQHLRPDDGG
jgi:hypothetical protein